MVVPVSCLLVVSCCVDRCGSSAELLCSFALNSQSTMLDRHFGLAECETFTLLHRYSPATSLARRIVTSENSIRLGVRNTLSGAPLKTFLTRRCKKINYPSSSVGFLFLFLQRLHIHRSRRKSSRSSWSVAHGNNYPYYHLCEACRTSFRSRVDRRVRCLMEIITLIITYARLAGPRFGVVSTEETRSNRDHQMLCSARRATTPPRGKSKTAH